MLSPAFAEAIFLGFSVSFRLFRGLNSSEKSFFPLKHQNLSKNLLLEILRYFTDVYEIFLPYLFEATALYACCRRKYLCCS